MKKTLFVLFVLLALTLSNVALLAKATSRIKDITYINGIRKNQLRGYGLVVGLAGKGDSSKNPITVATVQNFLENIGINLDSPSFQTKNLAVVMVTAEIDAFAHEGDRITIQVSSIGDAKSLEGGVLLQTALKAADDNVYAVAQGPIIVNGSSKTTAMLPQGAIIERTITSEYIEGNDFTLVLNHGDFKTIQNITEAITEKYPETTVVPNNMKNITITVPEEYNDKKIEFISLIQEIEVESDNTAKIVIDEKSGVVVIGEDVRVASAGISIAGMKIEIDELTGERKSEPNSVIENSTTVQTLVDSLNALGVDIKEIIQILIALKNAGSLNAEIILQ